MVKEWLSELLADARPPSPVAVWRRASRRERVNWLLAALVCAAFLLGAYAMAGYF